MILILYLFTFSITNTILLHLFGTTMKKMIYSSFLILILFISVSFCGKNEPAANADLTNPPPVQTSLRFMYATEHFSIYSDSENRSYIDSIMSYSEDHYARILDDLEAENMPKVKARFWLNSICFMNIWKNSLGRYMLVRQDILQL